MLNHCCPIKIFNNGFDSSRFYLLLFTFCFHHLVPSSADGEDIVSDRPEELPEMIDENAEGAGREGIVLLPQRGEYMMAIDYLVLMAT